MNKSQLIDAVASEACFVKRMQLVR